MEIGNNLKGYEDVKWSQLLNYVFDIFVYDFKKA